MEPLETLRLRLKETIFGTSDYLASGQVKDMAEYARAVGKIAAMREILEEIRDIERRYTDN